MARDPSDGRCPFTGLHIRGHHCARKRMSQPGRYAVLVRSVIMQVLVQWSSDYVLDCRFHSMRCETRAQPLSESACAAAVFRGAMEKLVHACPRRNTRDRALAESSLPPMLHIRVLAAGFIS